MDISMSSEEVMKTIRQLNENGGSLNKKSIKKSNPQLMRSALHYFPSWDSAIEKSISS